jgi:hypothetical protein
LAGRFLVVLSVAPAGERPPRLGAAGDAGNGKCLAGAVNFFLNAEIAVLARSAARWLGSCRLPAGREPAGNRFDSYRRTVRVLLLSSGNAGM